VKSVTVAPAFIKAMLEGAVSKGYNAEEILEAQGIPVQTLYNERLRVSSEDFARLSQSLTVLLRDETMGLLAEPQKMGTFKLLARASIGSRTLAESLRQWKDGINLLAGSISGYTQFTDDIGTYAIDAQLASSTTTSYIIESSLCALHRTHCWLAGDFIPIQQVQLRTPMPSYASEYRYMFFGAPVLFDQTRNAISFPRESLLLEPQRNMDDLDELLRRPQESILTQARHSTSVSIKLREWMERSFRQGANNPQLPLAAIHFGTTPQTLRRRLKTEGYSFQQLKEDTRRDLAFHLITNKHLKIEAVAFELGFTEASNFIRAFKGWTGMTPLAYRNLRRHG